MQTKSIFRRSVFLALLLSAGLFVVFFTQEQNAATTVTITEFSDFQCPYCKRAASTVEQVRQAYGERVKVVFKQMPLQMHQHAFKAAQASVCADEQGRFWEYHDRLFAAPDLSPDTLNTIASEVGLDQAALNQCLASDRSRTRVQADLAEAERLGVSGTPTFFVNGKPIKGANNFAALKIEIDKALLSTHGPLRTFRQPQNLLNTTSATFQGEQVPESNKFTDSLVVSRRPTPAAPSNRISGALTFSPGTIDFGYVLVGSTTLPASEIVINSSTTPVVINGISISGRDRGDFVLSYDFPLPVTLAPGQNIKLGVTFSPHLPWKAGTRDANLQLTPQKGAFQPVPLTGIGATCGGPLPACSSGCPDADSDGLNNTWETAGGIDINNDGRIDAVNDVVLAGADPIKPDIYVWYDWMDYGLGERTCATDLNCTSSGRYHKGETCNAQGQCVYSCNTDSDCSSRWPTEAHAGERCISNVCEHTHDPLVQDANAFQAVADRFAAHGINLHILRGAAQPHSHVVSFRDDAQMTIGCEGATADNVGLGKYAVSLYDLKSRNNPDKRNLAYRYVVFSHYSSCDSSAHCNSCPTPGFTFGQTGVSELSGNDFIVSLGGITNDVGLVPHYIVSATFMHELGHSLGVRHDGHLDASCSSDADCPTGDTCADFFSDGQGKVCHGTFGGVPGAEEPNYKPNYLSIMNYRYQRTGIPIAASVGGRVRLRCNNDSDCGGNGAFCLAPPANSNCSITSHVCMSNADCSTPGDFCVSPPVPPKTCSTTGYACVTDSDCTNGDSCLAPSAPGVCVRLDYSSQTLPTGGITPGALDEANLDDTVGLGSGTSDLFSYTDALCHTCWRLAPTTGPVNWVGTGIFFTPDCSLYLSGVESFTDAGVQADIDAADTTACDLFPQDVLHGHTDWPDLSGISFNYAFQCTPNGSR